MAAENRKISETTRFPCPEDSRHKLCGGFEARAFTSSDENHDGNDEDPNSSDPRRSDDSRHADWLLDGIAA